MKKIKILQEVIHIAEKVGDVTDVGMYETWFYVTAMTEDGTKVKFDINITKEEEENA